MRCAHLFNGIGGFALAAHWMGWENFMHCEIDPFCNRVMEHHFPLSIQHEDIRATDFSLYQGAIDLVTGGFPCQPYSTAGARKGNADERHLWPHMLRAIREIQPGWVVGENVRGLLSWNRGLVFEEIQANLEAEGYEILPFLLPAGGVGAVHKRERIFFVAYSHRFRLDQQIHTTQIIQRREQAFGEPGPRHPETLEPSHTSGPGLPGTEQKELPGKGEQQKGRTASQLYPTPDWDGFPAQSPVCAGNDGLSYGLDALSFSKWRENSIKALGNAIVPQVAYQIFNAISVYEIAQNALNYDPTRTTL